MIANPVDFSSSILHQSIRNRPGETGSSINDVVYSREDQAAMKPALIPSQITDTFNGLPVNTPFSHQEEIKFFQSDTTIEYQGEGGSKLFISYSYTAISRKVHYEMVQNGEENAAKSEKHPSHLNYPYGPEAASGRILEFAQHLINKFRAMEGAEECKIEKLIKKMVKGVEKGFKRAFKQLNGSSSRIMKMMEKTYKMVMKGMDGLKKGGEWPHTNDEKRITFNEDITYTSASLKIHVVA